MFFAELICLLVYFVHKGLTAPKRPDNSPALKHKLLFCISSSFDMLNFLLSVFGLTMTAASVYQMMYGGTLFWTFIFSITYLKRKYHRHHYLAVTLLLLGLITVGLAGIIWSKKSSEGTPTKPLGVVLIIIAQLFSAMQNVYEERIFSQYNVNPMQATGIEGAAGIVYTAIILPIVNNWSCTPQTDAEGHVLFCPFGRVEDSILALKQIASSLPLAIFVLGYTVSTVFFNSIGISIVKYTSSMERTVISCLRIFMVWIISIMIGWEDLIFLQVCFSALNNK